MLSICCGVFGILVGSFLNALIYRLPRDINIVFPRSACPHCQKVIVWYENIPVLSFLWLRGRCSGCKKKISWRYPFIEILTSAASLALAPSVVDLPNLLHFAFYFSVFCCFVVHFFIDWEHQILPDSINLYLALIFFFYSFFEKPWTHWLLGSLIGVVFPGLVTWLFYLWRKIIGLGGGDIKLYGALGIFLGPTAIVYNIFLSCFLGSIYALTLLINKKMKKNDPIPFGPFIILVAVWQIYFPEHFDRTFLFLQ
jgi:prepilin signal peptidase PulO-like enzyme (type II secretory pathway)